MELDFNRLAISSLLFFLIGMIAVSWQRYRRSLKSIHSRQRIAPELTPCDNKRATERNLDRRRAPTR